MATELPDLKLYALHHEDEGAPPGHPAPDSYEKGAGTLEIGVVIDGVRHALFKGKAGRFLSRREALRKQAAERPSEPEPEPQVEQ